MKITTTKNHLISALLRLLAIAGDRGLPVLSNVLFVAGPDGIELTSTDLEVTTRTSVEGEIEVQGGTAIPFRRLLGIVKEVDGGTISLSTDAKNITTLKCGPSLFKLHGLPKEDFPAFPALVTKSAFTVSAASLKDALRKTSFAISNESSRYVLNGILFSIVNNVLAFAATDGRRLATVTVPLETPSADISFIVPTKGIAELSKMLDGTESIAVIVADNFVSFASSERLLISKLVDGTFPNYKQVIPVDQPESVVLNRETLMNVVRRVSLLSSDKAGSVKLAFTEGTLTVSSNTPEVGEATESLSSPYSGSAICLALNPQFLLDGLRALHDTDVAVNFSNSFSPIVIKSPSAPSFLCVVMPMRVS